MTPRTKKLIRNIQYVGLFIALAFLLFVSSASAQTEYKPLVGLPKLPTSGVGVDIPKYINAVYLLTIGVGALIGVLRIAFAGVKYSLSDIITDKESAKKDIGGVLLGLAILLIPFIVLSTINPNLTNLDVLKMAPKTNLDSRNVNSASMGPTNLPNATTISPGTNVTSCRLSEVRREFVPGRTIEGGYQTIYDQTSCETACRNRGGTFSVPQPWTSVCITSVDPSPSGPAATPFNQGA